MSPQIQPLEVEPLQRQNIPGLELKPRLLPDPIPFDIDGYFNEWNISQPREKMGENKTNFTKVMYSFTKPFLAQGYNSMAALNRGTAGFYAHLDSITDFVEASGFGKKEGLFENLAKISAEKADYWKQRAEKVGIGFLDELISEAVGGFVPGVTKFSMDVASGFTFPYMAGAAEAAKRGEQPFAAGIVEAAKTGVLYGVFRMMVPLKKYLQAPTMGTIFGLQEMETAPEGEKAKAFAKGAGIGLAYSLASPGGRLGLNEIKKNLEPELAKVRELTETGGKVLASERGAIDIFRISKLSKEELELVADRWGIKWTGNLDEMRKKIVIELNKTEGEKRIPSPKTEAKEISKTKEKVPKIVELSFDLETILKGKPEEGQPETRPRKFLKTVEEASSTAPEIKERLVEIQKEEPQDYYVIPNKESLEKASKRIETEGLDKTVDYALSEQPLSAEKGATFIKLMEDFQKQGDYDRAIQMVEGYDMQLREAGRFVQAASIWNKLSPPGFIRWAEKQLDATKGKYSWVDTVFGNKPESFTLSKEEKKQIFEKMTEINKMPEGIGKTDATLEMIDQVAQKVPPSVSELIDAYRYQNMLSSPRTHMRNIGENIFNTFMTRPIDLTTRGAYDWTKSVLFGKERETYVSDVPAYMKSSINAVPNGIKAFMKVWSLESGAEIGKPEVGLEVKTEFQRARAKQMPSWLTIIPRFMEASDKFNSALIGAGEFTIQKERGATDAEAYQRASQLAEKYLYRDKLDPNDPDISYFSKALESVGKVIEQTRKLPGLSYLSKWYVPFIKTPINKGVQMVEHSPLGLARADFNNEAMGKIIAGSIFTGLGAIFAMEGDTTWSPPTDPKEKELFYAAGRKPFSVRIGDKWVPVWYLGPFALAFAIPAAVKYYVQDQKQSLTKDGFEKLLETAEGIAQFIGSQTSVQSIGALFSALNGDIDFKFTSQTAFTLEQIIPGQSLIRYVNTIIDPVYRKPKGFIEQIEKDLPILSQKLEERQTPLFEPSVRETHNYFLPYDIGTKKEIYESILPFQRYQLRQKHLENKVDELTKKVRKGEMTPEDSMKELMKIIEVIPKNLEQFGTELQKQGESK